MASSVLSWKTLIICTLKFRTMASTSLLMRVSVQEMKVLWNSSMSKNLGKPWRKLICWGITFWSFHQLTRKKRNSTSSIGYPSSLPSRTKIYSNKILWAIYPSKSVRKFLQNSNRKCFMPTSNGSKRHLWNERRLKIWMIGRKWLICLRWFSNMYRQEFES